MQNFDSDSQQARALRHNMIRTQMRNRDITDTHVLEVMEKVPRHLFAPFESLEEAYSDGPFSIECKQTISQPYMVAFMTQELQIKPESKVLEVGTGSGYQTAVLCELSNRVYSIERHSKLAESSKDLLERLGYHPVKLVTGDGSNGLPEEAPFDRIIVTAAASQFPRTLIEQLSLQGGIIIFPFEKEKGNQELLKIIRFGQDEYQTVNLGPVRFVPLVAGN